MLAPPGGKDSISFTASPSSSNQKNVNPCQAARNTSHVFEGNDFGFQSKGNVKSCQEARQKSSVFTAPLETLPVNQRKGQTGNKSHGNILATENNAQEKVHTSVQVKAPPGGVSHISFG